MAQPVSEIFQEKLASFLGHDENSQLDLSNHPPDALRQLIDTQNISAQILQKANSDDFVFDNQMLVQTVAPNRRVLLSHDGTLACLMCIGGYVGQ